MQFIVLLTAVLCTVLSVVAHDEENANTTGAYTLVDDLSYKSFFEAFNTFSDSDPTQGFVKYLPMAAAIEKGLVGYLDDTETVFMGVDYKTKDQKDGIASVRIEGKKGYNQGLMIADILHAPPSECGVWPAMWLLGSDPATDKMDGWPSFGEIDIMEGVNDYENNAVTLHTSKGCTVDTTTQLAADSTTPPAFTGNLTTSDCDVKAKDQPKNMGCSIKAPATVSNVQMGTGDSTEEADLPSYGTKFNAAGGGVYAMDWTSTYISVWFIPRGSKLYNEHFSGNATSSPDPSKWGLPIAHFSGSGCDYVERFKNLRLIFNITFCGKFAGDEKEWSKSCAAKTGAATCKEYVLDHPEKFEEAYWEVASVKWFQQNGTSSKRGVGKPAYVKRDKGQYQRV
jgi:hypothetical protein